MIHYGSECNELCNSVVERSFCGAEEGRERCEMVSASLLLFVVLAECVVMM